MYNTGIRWKQRFQNLERACLQINKIRTPIVETKFYLVLCILQVLPTKNGRWSCLAKKISVIYWLKFSFFVF